MELVVSNYIRNNYESKCNAGHVPVALQYIIIQFSNKIISCRFLTMKQDLDLYELLTTRLSNIRRFKSLYKASEHNYSTKQFHSLCDNKGATITIIKSEFGNVFGGYTSKSWKICTTYNGSHVTDKDAFLFMLESDEESIQCKCPLTFELKEDYEHLAVHHRKEYGPYFGWMDIAIVDCSSLCVTKHSYDYEELNGSSLCGGSTSYTAMLEYEVFAV